MKYKYGLAIGGLTFIPNLFRVSPSVLQMRRLHRVIELRLGSRPYGPDAPRPWLTGPLCPYIGWQTWFTLYVFMLCPSCKEYILMSWKQWARWCVWSDFMFYSEIYLDRWGEKHNNCQFVSQHCMLWPRYENWELLNTNQNATFNVFCIPCSRLIVHYLIQQLHN